jgi:CHAT domain-containing protein
MKRYLACLFFILLFPPFNLAAVDYSITFTTKPNNIRYFIMSPTVQELHVKCADKSTALLTDIYFALPLYFTLRSSETENGCLVRFSAHELNEQEELLVETYPERNHATAILDFSHLDSYLFGKTSLDTTDLENLIKRINEYANSDSEQISLPALARLTLYYQRLYQFKISNQYAKRSKEIPIDSDAMQFFFNMIFANNYFSLQQYEEALSIINSLLIEGNTKQLNAELKFNLFTLRGFSQVLSGELLNDQSLQLKGKQTLEEALVLCKLSAITDCQSEIYNGLATYARIQGQFDESAKMLELAIISLESIKRPDHIERLSNLTNNLALIYRWTGDLAKSQHYLRRSIYYDQALENPVSIAISYANLANSYRLLGDLPKAKRFYQRSLELSLEAGDQLNTTKTQLNLGQLFIAQGEHAAAVDILSKALIPIELSVINRQLLKSNLALALAKYGDKLHAKDLLQTLINQEFKANNEMERAEHILSMLEVAFELKDDSYIDNLERELEQSDLHSTSSILRFKNVELKTAIKRYQQLENNKIKAVQLEKIQDIYNQVFTEIMRTANTLDTDEIGIHWMTQTNQLTEYYVGFMLNSNDPNNYLEAWKISEQTTNLMIQRRHRYFRGRIEDSFEEKFTANSDLKTNLQNARLGALELKPTQQHINQLHIDALHERLLLSKDTAQMADNVAPNIAHINKKLANNEILLKYFLVEDQYFLLWANSQSWGLHKLSSQLNQLLKAYKSSDFSSGTPLAATIVLEDLLPDWILSKRNINRLVIIPDGDLHVFPFTLLKDAHGQYLGDRFELIRTLSATAYLDDISPTAHTNSEGIGIFSDPEFSIPHAHIKEKPLDGDWYVQFQRLPWTAEIASKITALFNGVTVKHITGSKATNSQLLSFAMRNSKILHIATHAYYDKHKPEQVGLVTSKDFSRSPSDQLGYLSIYDMLEHPIYSDLIIISACESQMGKHYGGEGVRGLAYSMLAQGAGSTIGTLWKVPDKPTALFMQNFYQAFSDNGGNTPQALQTARQIFIHSGRYKHPKYWAGFVLTVANRQYESINLN